MLFKSASWSRVILVRGNPKNFLNLQMHIKKLIQIYKRSKILLSNFNKLALLIPYLISSHLISFSLLSCHPDCLEMVSLIFSDVDAKINLKTNQNFHLMYNLIFCKRLLKHVNSVLNLWRCLGLSRLYANEFIDDSILDSAISIRRKI